MITWQDIIDNVRISLGEDNKTFFTDQKMKLVAHDIQQRIFKATKCGQNAYAFTTTPATTGAVADYELPIDFLETLEVRVDDQPVDQQLHRPNVYSFPIGQPQLYWIENNHNGQRIGFTPTPSSALNASMIYARLSPSYGLVAWHTEAHDATAATISVDEDGVEVVITGGAKAGTYSLTFSEYPTLAEMRTALRRIGGINLPDVTYESGEMIYQGRAVMFQIGEQPYNQYAKGAVSGEDTMAYIGDSYATIARAFPVAAGDGIKYIYATDTDMGFDGETDISALLWHRTIDGEDFYQTLLTIDPDTLKDSIMSLFSATTVRIIKLTSIFEEDGNGNDYTQNFTAAIAGATRWDVDAASWVAYSTALNPATEEIKLWGDDGAGGEYDTPGLVIKASLPGDIDPDRASSLLEEVDAESILGRNNKQYLFTIPEFPPEAKETLMTGITEVMKFSDREIETSMLKLAVFDKMLKDLEKKWKMKQFSNGFPAFGGGPRTGFGSSWFKTIVP